jgi:RNA polymerase sigma-70 factor
MPDPTRVYLGNAQSFKMQYEMYFTSLKYFAKRYIDNEEAIHDIIQDIFVKLWEQKMDFENEQVFKTYLYRAVRNNCLTYIQHEKKRHEYAANNQEEEIEEAFINQVIKAEVYALINDVFKELPEMCRKVYARSLEGKSHQEISEELHIAINTIKRHKNKANHYLRERLEKLLSLVLYLS